MHHIGIIQEYNFNMTAKIIKSKIKTKAFYPKKTFRVDRFTKISVKKKIVII